MRYLFLFISILYIGACFGQAEISKSDTLKTLEKDVIDAEQQPVQDAPVHYKNRERTSEKKVSKIQSVNNEEVKTESVQTGAMAKEVNLQSEQFNYYRSQSKVQTQQRSPSRMQQTQMNDAVTYFESYAPASFEYHYYKYVSGNYNTALISHLLTAEKLRPLNADVHVQLAAYYMISNSAKEAKVYLKKLAESGRLKNSVLVYAVDVLNSVPSNGILVTHGFDDTYGAWFVQQMNGQRKDVTIISLDLLQSEEFRSELKQKGFVIPTSKVIDVAFLSEFCKKNSQIGVSIALTTPKEYFKPILNSVYLTGLVFEYRNDSFDNFWRNQELWERGLQKSLISNTMDENGKALVSNYLPMLLQMRKVYNQSGNQVKVEEMDAAIDQIGAECNKYQQVQKLKSAY